jgi:hypothetical protein
VRASEAAVGANRPERVVGVVDDVGLGVEDAGAVEDAGVLGRAADGRGRAVDGVLERGGAGAGVGRTAALELGRGRS